MGLREVTAHAQLGFPILSALLALPAVTALALLFVRGERALRRLALGGALAELALAGVLVARFAPRTSDVQFAEQRAWLPTIHSTYHVGVDGISVLFVPLTALLTVLVMLYSWHVVRSMVRAHLCALLVLEAVTVGIFVSLDLVLFFVFWELLLVPSYFLITLWGVGPQRRHAASKYVMYMLAGSAPVLLAFLALALDHRHHAPHAAGAAARASFDYLDLLATPVSPRAQVAVFFLLFFGFAVKGPVFPLHTWLPTAVMESPIGMAAILTGVKLGTYAMLRFVLPLAPDATRHYAGLMAALGVAGILHGALVALVSVNLRRMLAYASLSHVGFIVLGLASLTPQGVHGALIQMLNMAVISTGLMFVAGFLYSRTGSNELTALGGLARRVPRMAVGFLLLGVASIGLPGTNGFAGEHLILLGAFRTQRTLTLLALGGVVLGAGYLLRFFERAFLGPRPAAHATRVEDLRPRERVIVVALALLVLFVGLHPGPVLDITGASVQFVVARLNPGP